MKTSSILEYFFRKALVKSKQERFVGFSSSKKGLTKILKSLDDELLSCLNNEIFTSKFPNSELDQIGNFYCSNGTINEGVESMRHLYDSAPWEGGWLLMSDPESIAIYRPEGKIDSELYIRL